MVLVNRFFGPTKYREVHLRPAEVITWLLISLRLLFLLTLGALFLSAALLTCHWLVICTGG